jgi:hypothetical protein
MRVLADRGAAVCLLLGLLVGGVMVLARPQPWWSHVLVAAGTGALLMGVLAVSGIADEYVQRFASNGTAEGETGELGQGPTPE